MTAHFSSDVSKSWWVIKWTLEEHCFRKMVSHPTTAQRHVKRSRSRKQLRNLNQKPSVLKELQVLLPKTVKLCNAESTMDRRCLRISRTLQIPNLYDSELRQRCWSCQICLNTTVVIPRQRPRRKNGFVKRFSATFVRYRTQWTIKYIKCTYQSVQFMFCLLQDLQIHFESWKGGGGAEEAQKRLIDRD